MSIVIYILGAVTAFVGIFVGYALATLSVNSKKNYENFEEYNGEDYISKFGGDE